MTHLNCPKCPSQLSRRDLLGVEIDQCEQCHGIFLDRGELEDLLDAEHRFSRGREPGAGTAGGRRRRNDVGTLTELPEESTDYEGRRRQRQEFLNELFS